MTEGGPAPELTPLAEEIRRHDWTAFRTFIGDASTIPAALMATASVTSAKEVESAYWRIDNVIMVDGRLSEAVEPVTSCLLVALDLVERPARGLVLDLLAVIATGYQEHVDTQVVGRAPVGSCVAMMATRLPTFIEELFTRGDSSCVDILLMCAHLVEETRTEVRRALDEAMTLRSCLSIRNEIEMAIDDLPQ